MTNPINHFLNKIVTFGALMIVVVSTFTLGPWIEGKFFPIATDVEVEFIKVDGDKMIYQAYGKKSRNCTVLDIRVSVETDEFKHPVKGAIWVIDDGIGSVVRPLGQQNLGLWAITPVGNRANIYGAYRCHRLWDTEVHLGEWTRTKKGTYK